MRQPYGQTLREIIAWTVEDPIELDQELSELLQVVKQQS